MIDTFFTILAFILGLSILIFLHELGHFLAARAFKIEVEEFGFGYPPRAKVIGKSGNTIISLNWIPFGGFVRIKGEMDPDVPGGFYSVAAWKRLLVILAAPVVNLVVAFLIFSLIFTRTGVPDSSRALVVDVNANSPALIAGLKPGDIITQVDEVVITSVAHLTNELKARAGKETTLIIARGDEIITTSLTPRLNPPPGEGAIGIAISNPIRQVTSYFDVVPFTFDYLNAQIVQLLQLPGRLIRGELSGAEGRIVGPVGMYSIFQRVVQPDAGSAQPLDIETLLLRVGNFWAVISMALGVTNLLPIPALDGGRILFLLPEIVLRKRIPSKYENALVSFTYLLLLGLMAFVTIQDIINPIQLP